MSPSARALLGAAIGAVVTLCAHPKSRPFMLGVTARSSPTAIELCLDSHQSKLASPQTLDEASLWMQLAATRIAKLDHLSKSEQNSLLQVAISAGSKDRTNAFWPQMQAVIYAEGEHASKAVEAWKRASSCLNWDDYQTNRLLQDRARISELTGVNEAWQLAFVYYLRSEDVAICLRNLSRLLLQNADYETLDGLNLRHATLLNGDLLRKHAHSSKSSLVAMDMVNLTSYPSDSLASASAVTPSPKKLWAGEDMLIRNFTQIASRPDWSTEARKIFSDNESWRALTVHDSNVSQSQFFAAGSVVTSSIASAVMVVALVGFLIWVAGNMVFWRLSRQQHVQPVVAGITAVALGLLVFWFTQDYPAAFGAALCGGFLFIAPDRSRKAKPSDLGPLFSLVIILIALLCASLLTIDLVGSTSAANALFPSLGVSNGYFDKPLLAGMSLVAFGLIFLTAPIWAVVNRLGTPYVLSLALTKFGVFVAISGLLCTIILGPFAVYSDQRLEGIFLELVRNEPVHYYMQR